MHFFNLVFSVSLVYLSHLGFGTWAGGRFVIAEFKKNRIKILDFEILKSSRYKKKNNLEYIVRYSPVFTSESSAKLGWEREDENQMEFQRVLF